MVMIVVTSPIHVNDIVEKSKQTNKKMACQLFLLSEDFIFLSQMSSPLKRFSTVTHCHRIYISILGLQAKLGSQIPVSFFFFLLPLHCTLWCVHL